MTSHLNHAALDRIASKYARRDDTTQVRFAVSHPATGESWSWQQPGATDDFFLASSTKLFTTAIVCQLAAEGSLSFDTPAAQLLPTDALAGVHVIDGVDRSDEVTIAQLLGHTSGIADYFEGTLPSGSTVFDDLQHEDFGWDTKQALEWAREIGAKFAPGEKGRALYSDTNFQILQWVIEELDGKPYAESVATRICSPLGLSRTRIFGAQDVARYGDVAGFLHGTEELRIPLAMASVQADGGGVSTTQEALTFLEAFFAGRLFPASMVETLTAEWRRIFFPLQYGLGVMRFKLPWYLTLRPTPELIGHSGATGTVTFAAPSRGLYVAGSVNQTKNRSLVYRAVSEILAKAV